jgi:hypothetical protein
MNTNTLFTMDRTIVASNTVNDGLIEKTNQLRTESQARCTNPSTIVNQIIKEHFASDALATQAKLYYMPKRLLRRIVNQLTEQELSELARDTAMKDVLDITLMLRSRSTIVSILNIAKTWLKVSRLPHRCEITGSSCKIIIEHDMGFKYSYLIKEISRYILEVAFKANGSFDITDEATFLTLFTNSDSSFATVHKIRQLIELGTECTYKMLTRL